MKKRILIINGSLGGDRGNTVQALNQLARALGPQVDLEWLHLATLQRESTESSDLSRQGPESDLEKKLKAADGFVFATGTYWDSWSSHLQRFFEEATEFEASDIWLGKPAAVFVTMHSVGGKGVLSRLQGVLSTLGLLLPPMSSMVYSLANQLALEAVAASNHASGHGTGQSAGQSVSHADDLWQLRDLDIIAHNLIEALKIKSGQTPEWRPWPVDSQDPTRVWIQS